MSPPPPPTSHGKKILWIVVVLALLAGGAGAYFLYSREESVTNDSGPTDLVTRGPLTVSITESGVIKAGKRRVISNELRWPVVIKKVVEEGTRVKAGETIIEFECKELTDAIVQQKITVSTAKNSYTQAHEGLELKRKELANKVAKAQQAVSDAQEDLKRYLERQRKINLAEAESEVALAKQDLKLAQDRLSFKVKANEDPALNQPYSANEIEAERLTVERLKLKLEKSNNALDMLKDYDDARQERLLRTAVEDAKLDIEKITLEQKTELMVAEAAEQTAKATLDMKVGKLNEMLEDEGKLIQKAEKEGLVVYDSGGSSWHRGRSEEVEVAVGEKINSRQQLMIIPDMTTLRVETKVYESMIENVKEDLEAFVRLDAKRDTVLHGKIGHVGVLPTSKRWVSTIKMYTVIIEFDGDVDASALKPNMTANVEMIIARLDDVLSVPVASVFTEQDQTFCWKVTPAGPQRVPVKTGLMNDERVQILSGLKENDRVLLVPAEGEDQPLANRKKKSAKEPAPKAGPEAGKGGASSGAPGKGRPPAGTPSRKPGGAPSGARKPPSGAGRPSRPRGAPGSGTGGGRRSRPGGGGSH